MRRQATGSANTLAQPGRVSASGASASVRVAKPQGWNSSSAPIASGYMLAQSWA